MVVIVGASSGVGRATARAFAERGDRLVLAARSTTTLAEVRAECADVDVLTVPTDVTEPGALEALAGAAIVHFGGVDVWVHAGGGSQWTAGRRARRLGLRSEPGRRGGTRRPSSRPAATRVSDRSVRWVPHCADGSADLFGTVRYCSEASCIDQLA
ncbi:SDR family NAD(P)-dependent oxidoreductase [Micromonospora arborensis]|uniref:SDR family NAD(P)-dependent oxidoreductase n=1 Tax=Micromonospora arborensis TaxID=2116518 RepID=UPI0034039AD7